MTDLNSRVWWLPVATVLLLTSGSVAQVCGDLDAGDCCTANGTPACDDAECCDLVCATDSFCCVLEWDDICARQAAEVCNLGCAPSVCPLQCPPGALHENEPCGGDTNGGCNSFPPVYTPAACGLTFCGTAWADGGLRDTDWYLVDLPDPDGNGTETISATLTSQFPGSCVIADVSGGDCRVLVQVGTIGCGDACGNIAVASATLPAPATYAVFVAPGLCDFSDIADGYPCGDGSNNYLLTIECAATCDIDAAIALLETAMPIQGAIVGGFGSAGTNLDAADVKLANSDDQLAVVETQLGTADGLLASADTQLASADAELASVEALIPTASTAIDSALANSTAAGAATDQATIHFEQVATLALACEPCGDPGTNLRISVKLLLASSQINTAILLDLESQVQVAEAAIQNALARDQAQRARDQANAAALQILDAASQTQSAVNQQLQARSQLSRALAKSDQAAAQSSAANSNLATALLQLAPPVPQILRSIAKVVAAKFLNVRAAAKGTAATTQSANAATLAQRSVDKQIRIQEKMARAEAETTRSTAQTDRAASHSARAESMLARSGEKLASSSTECARASQKTIDALSQAFTLSTVLTKCGPCADAALVELGLGEDAIQAAIASLDLAIQDLADAGADVAVATAAAAAATSALQDASADLSAAVPELTGALSDLGDSILNTQGAVVDINAAISDLEGASGDIDVVDPILLETIGILSACPDCQWDIDQDGQVGINDFLDLLAAWGPNPGHPADFDGDDIVGITDFLELLANWGPCPV